MAVYFTIIFSFYFLLLLTLTIAWGRVTQKEKQSSLKNIFISVVIPMRNESLNIERLLQSLSKQNYRLDDFEVILVDDHSDDGSMAKVDLLAKDIFSVQAMRLDENHKGKKAALSLGIANANGDIITTTDADCEFFPGWLQSISNNFQDPEVNMLIGGVALQNETRFFSRLQAIEFASVIGTGMALCKLGMPTMCNGANLSFRKQIFANVNGYDGNQHIASGDDEFLMRKFQDKYPGSIRTLSTPESTVITKSHPSLKGFIQQRLRWASKWKANSSAFARIFAVFIFLIQCSWLWFLIWIPSSYNLITIVSVLVLKIAADLIFLTSVCRALNMKFSLLQFGVLQFLYPIYVVFIGFFSQIKNYEWKGRTL